MEFFLLVVQWQTKDKQVPFFFFNKDKITKKVKSAQERQITLIDQFRHLT